MKARTNTCVCCTSMCKALISITHTAFTNTVATHVHTNQNQLLAHLPTNTYSQMSVTPTCRTMLIPMHQQINTAHK